MNEDPLSKFPKESKELLSQLTSDSPEHVDFSIEYARSLFNSELDRSNEVERKAALLVGAGGVAAAIITALAGFLINFPAMLPDWSRCVILALFAALAVTFLATIFFSLKVLWVGKSAYPGPSPLLIGQELNAVEYKKLHIADLFIAYVNNAPETNSKVNSLALAQKFFLASLLVLFATGSFIAATSLWLD